MKSETSIPHLGDKAMDPSSMTITLSGYSASVSARGYAHTENDLIV